MTSSLTPASANVRWSPPASADLGSVAVVVHCSPLAPADLRSVRSLEHPEDGKDRGGDGQP